LKKNPTFSIIAKRFAFVIVAFFILDVAFNTFLRLRLEASITQATGLENSVGALDISFWDGSLRAKEILLYNNEAFEERNFLRISDCYGELDRLAWLRGMPHLPKLWLVVEELFIIRNQDGMSNLDRLRERTYAKGTSDASVHVGRLNLAFNNVIYQDHGPGKRRTRMGNREVRHEHFTDLTSIEEIAEALFVKALSKEWTRF